jgi:hypothetical protein
MIKGVRSFSSLLTHYLCERDALTANMTRFGAGFVLDSHLREAKEQINNIKSLVEEIERRKDEPKPKLFLINGGCGGGACSKK